MFDISSLLGAIGISLLGFFLFAKFVTHLMKRRAQKQEQDQIEKDLRMKRLELISKGIETKKYDLEQEDVMLDQNKSGSSCNEMTLVGNQTTTQTCHEGSSTRREKLQCDGASLNSASSTEVQNNSNDATCYSHNHTTSSFEGKIVKNKVEINDEECPICLESFEIGQELSWSRQNKCYHIFHTQCITPWLMTRYDCPCCRTSLLDDVAVSFLKESNIIENSNDGNSNLADDDRV